MPVLVINKEKFDALVTKNQVTEGEIMECLAIHSINEYKEKGGTKTVFQLYYALKKEGKSAENKFISMLDMKYSGIPVDNSKIMYYKRRAQVYYELVHLLFREPVRMVSYSSFDLKEFEEF